MERTQLAAAIVERSYLTGEFILRSGKATTEYFDKYLFESDPPLLRAICEHLAELLPEDIEVLAGLELGGVPIAAVIGQITGLPVYFVRKQQKTYGTCRLAEGSNLEGKRLLVVEDVVSSGGQIVLSVADLQRLGAVVEKAVCVIDREMGGPQSLSDECVSLTSLFTMSQLAS